MSRFRSPLNCLSSYDRTRVQRAVAERVAADSRQLMDLAIAYARYRARLWEAIAIALLVLEALSLGLAATSHGAPQDIAPCVAFAAFLIVAARNILTFRAAARVNRQAKGPL